MPRSPFFDPAFYENPYPAYARLRAERPLDWCRPLRAWTVARYDDVAALLRDPRIGSNRPEFLLSQVPADEMPKFRPLLDSLAQWIVLTDPPKHTEVREVLMRGFSPRVLERMRPRVQQVVGELFDAVAEADVIEFVQSIAAPLPAIVIAELLGVPPKDRHRFRACAGHLARMIGSAGRTVDMAESAQAAIVEFTSYLRDLVASREGDEGFLDVLMAEGSPHLEGDKLAAHLIALLFAAHETTTNLLGAMVFTLLSHPGELERLRSDPTLVASTVEECVRWESPGHALSRTVLEEIELHGEKLRPDDRLLLLTGSANRDREHFSDPERFDVGRTERHMGFGYGVHFCAGVALARMEAQIVLTTLLERAPALRLAGVTPRWNLNLALRGLQHLHVAFA